MQILKLVLAAALLVAGEARAGVYIEPYVGYGMGKVNYATTIGSSKIEVSSNMKGPGYGGRVGLKGMMFAIGGEVQGSNMKFDGGGSWKTTDLGAFIGVFAPLGFRAWFTYFFSTKAGDIKGTGWKAGLGLRFFRHLAINVEHLQYDYKAYAITPTASLKISASANAVTLSMPFSF